MTLWCFVTPFCMQTSILVKNEIFLVQSNHWGISTDYSMCPSFRETYYKKIVRADSPVIYFYSKWKEIQYVWRQSLLSLSKTLFSARFVCEVHESSRITCFSNKVSIHAGPVLCVCKWNLPNGVTELSYYYSILSKMDPIFAW